MEINGITAGIIAVVVAYLMGSIPGAYIVTRFLTGKDIRKLGGGNVGANNVYNEVGLKAAIPVALIDVGKGAAAVIIAHRLVGLPLMQTPGLPQIFVLASALAAVVGHIWPIYLRFAGGNGLATTIGILAILMPRELLIALALAVVLIVITRNLVLSVNLSLLTLLVFAWFSADPRQYFIFLIILALILIIHFVPDAKAALTKAGSKEKLLAELVRMDENSKKPKREKKSKSRSN